MKFYWFYLLDPLPPRPCVQIVLWVRNFLDLFWPPPPSSLCKYYVHSPLLFHISMALHNWAQALLVLPIFIRESCLEPWAKFPFRVFLSINLLGYQLGGNVCQELLGVCSAKITENAQVNWLWFWAEIPFHSVFSVVSYWLTQCQRIRIRSIKNVKDDAEISFKFCVRPFERRKLNFELMDFYASPDSEAVTWFLEA